MAYDSTAVRVGPGKLWGGPIDAVEPTNISTAMETVDADYFELGYTAEGSTFNASLTVEGIDVAEAMDMIAYATTGREMTVEFALAKTTAKNMEVAFNGGTLTTGTGIITFEPPEDGDEVRMMIVWESDDGLERWVFRQCLSASDISMARQKAPAKTTIPVGFRLEKPTGKTPFKAIFDDSLAG